MASLISQILVAFLTLRLKVVFSQDFTYLGCFYDNNRREVLPDLIYCDRSTYPYQSCQNTCGPQAQYCQSGNQEDPLTGDMTIELCRDICAYQNMRFFGLQAGTQCLCGGYFAPYDRLGQPSGLNGTCSRPCSGNPSQMCGGDFQVSVYQINEPGSDCFNPGYVLNGDQSQQDNTFYNASDVIDYASVCSPPSIKDGAASITCSASGNWTNPPPTCTVRCATPTAPPHSHFSAGQSLNENYAVDAEVLYDCDNDPTRANLTLTCGYYGDWSSTLPDCAEPTTRGTSTIQSTTTPTSLPPTTTSTTSTARGGITGGTFQTVITGPSTTESTTVTMSTQPSTPSTSTDGSISPSSSITGNPSSSSSSGPLSSTGHGATSPEATATMTSTPVREGTSTPSATDGGAGTTPDSGRNTGNDMDWIPIIIGAAAGVLLLILVIIVVSVCCSRKRKQKKKNIPFDPALGASFGNPAFENDEAEQSRRGFVQENDYGDRQTYDIGVSDYAMAVDETDRVPPDGKDSTAGVGNGVEEGMYAVVNKNRQDAAGS